MLNAVIIDDEKKARDILEFLVECHFTDINLLGMGGSVVEGIKLIANKKPQLVFLDIEMQDGSGFDVLDAFPDANFEVIFVTAYDQYAIKAFKYSAVDYILKPIDQDDLIGAVDRAKKRIDDQVSPVENYKSLKTNIQDNRLSRIVIPSAKGYEYLVASEVVRFEADGRYTKVYLADRKMITVTKTLKDFVDLVDNQMFYRTHKSHLINLNYVKMFLKADGGNVLMKDGSEVAITNANKNEFLQLMLNVEFQNA